jgi:transposase
MCDLLLIIHVARRDMAAVQAAASPWSNGQTQGQVTKLKLVKRQMCGRARSTCCRPGSSVDPNFRPLGAVG